MGATKSLNIKSNQTYIELITKLNFSLFLMKFHFIEKKRYVTKKKQ